MKTLLKTTVSYDRDYPYLSLDVGDSGIDSIALERRYAGWYATLDYAGTDGITRNITPTNWVRYRDIYMLEYSTDNAYYELKIKENTDSSKLTVFLGVQSQNNDEN